MRIETELKKIGKYLYVNARIPDAEKGAAVNATVFDGGKKKLYSLKKEPALTEKITPYYPEREVVEAVLWQAGNNFSFVTGGAEKITFSVDGKKNTIDLSGSKTIEEVGAVLDKIKRVFILFNCNIDKIKYLDEDVRRLEKEHGSSAKEMDRIGSVEDLVSGLLFAMKSGESLELAMDEKTSDWINASIRPNKIRMGGQAGIMANYLTSMGVSSMVYTPLLSRDQCALFNKEVLLLIGEKLKHPSSAARDDKKKINWIFEFYKNDRLDGVKAKTDGRFIAASRPDEFRIGKMNTRPIKEADCVIISGFQGIKERYCNGETYREQFSKAAALLRKIKVPVHLELASTKSEAIRKAIVKIIMPCVDSIGLDESELEDLLLTVGEGGLSKKIASSRSIIDIFNGLIRLKHILPVGKIHLHGSCYFLAVCDRDYHVTPQEIKKAMEFAAVAAAAKAVGRLNSRGDLWNGLTVPESKEARKKELQLKGYLKGKKIRMQDGVATFSSRCVIFTKNRMAERVADVVGLGDVISASIFVAENAYRIAKK